MLNENRLYSISLGVACLQDGLVGVATALSPAMAGHFKFLLRHFFVRLGLIVPVFLRPYWKASFLAMRRVPLPVPSKRNPERSNLPMEELCFWMKLRVFRW